MGPSCFLHFIGNKSTNSLARLDFPIDSAILFFDNSLCSNVHSTSIESKVLNIFFNNFDENFFVGPSLLLNIRSSRIRFALKIFFEWCADSDARLPNFERYCLAHKLFLDVLTPSEIVECNQIILQLYNQVWQIFFPCRDDSFYIHHLPLDLIKTHLKAKLSSLATNFNSAGTTTSAIIDFFRNPILDSMLASAEMFVPISFSQTCDSHRRCIGMCLELSCFATSYSS